MRYLGFIGVLSILMAACSFTQKIKTGMQAYDVKQYSVAASLFEKEYDASQNNAEKARLAFLAGESYSYLNDQGSASIWYNKAYKDGFGEQALERYANSLKSQERYEEALHAYEELLKLNPSNTTYRGKVTLVKQAMDWSRHPQEVYEVNAVSFNSTSSDYSPQIIGPGLVLFTSDRGSKQSNDTYKWTGRSFSDLFLSNAGSSQVAEFDAGINSPDNDGAAVISPDGNTLVFTRCHANSTYDAWCQLMISYKKGSGWTVPEKLPFEKEKVNYGQPAFAANGTTLFFSSDAPEGQGGHDIYFSQMDESGSWSEPVNLGTMINTMGNEQYPTVYKDTLYFSSDHIAGLGGLDIFKTYLNQKNEWAAPINLRAPINSGGDDFGFVVDTFAKLSRGEIMKGYFTSAREGTSRNDDIYAFTLKGLIDQPVVVNNKPEEKPGEDLTKFDIYLSLKVMEPIYEVKDDPNSKQTGKRNLPNGPVIISVDMADQRYVTDELGQLILKLEPDTKYLITARYRDHLAATLELNTHSVARNPNNPITTINEVMVLDPIFRNKEIVLENIFYDYDQWFIRDDAKPALDYLSNIMKANPNIRIQLSSHTDCRGTDEYNLDLSQKRAQAAVEYLISTGIPAKRLEAHGYGESNLAVKCDCDSCPEEMHQKKQAHDIHYHRLIRRPG